MKRDDEPSVIKLDNEIDVSFLKAAEGALFNNTTLPSGQKTPPYRMIAIDGVLVRDDDRRA